MREHVNPINHEPCVGFQFLKLFWNPYTISKPYYKITFMIRRKFNFFFCKNVFVKTDSMFFLDFPLRCFAQGIK